MQRRRVATCRACKFVRALGSARQDIGDAELGGDARRLGHQTIVDQLDEFGHRPNVLAIKSCFELRHGSASHSTLTPVAATTFRHRSLSSLRKAAVSAGEVPTGVTENSRNF